jgi:hypothetical protein
MAILLHCFLVTNLSNGDSLASIARWLTLHNWTLNCTVAPVVFKITHWHGPCKKHSLCCWWDMFTGPLPSNRSPTVANVGSRGNVFTKSLPSNGSIHHNILIHLNFQTLDDNCKSSVSKCAYAVEMICCQGHCSQQNDATSTKARCVLLINKTKYMKWVQCYLMEFEVDPHSKPSIFFFLILQTVSWDDV